MSSRRRSQLALVLAVALGALLGCQAQCSGGQELVGGSCVTCAAGTKRAMPDPPICTPCEPGTFSAAGQSTCQLCPVNRYSSDYGASSCMTCPAGSIAKTNSGAVGLTGSTYCDPCPAGTYAAMAGSNLYNTCELCPSGTYRTGDATPGNTVCLQIPAGYKEKAGSSRTAYVPCDKGQVSFWTGSTRTPADGLTCQPCTGDNKYAPRKGMGACVACPGGTYPTDSDTSIAGNDQCTKCTGITYRPFSSSSATCLPCTAGKEVAGSGNAMCLSCRPGFYNPASDDTTDLAKNAKFAACQPCPANSYQPNAGQASCLLCPAGKSTHGVGSTSCVDCPKGTYSPKPDIPCKPAPRGGYVDVTGAANWTPCPVGTFGSVAGLTACEPCGPGQYSSTPGSQLCKTCTPGTYSKSQSSNCTACPAGYTSITGSPGCIACKPGTYASGTGAATCGQCTIGNQCPAIAMRNPQPCRRGYFNDRPGSRLCRPCPDDTFTDQTGRTSCRACPAGTTTAGLTGQSACRPQRPTSLRRMLRRLLRLR